VWKKVEEEMQELQVEVEANSPHIEEEFGDVLFSLVNYARFIGISPENALAQTNQKFIHRFQLMEEMIQEAGMDIRNMNLAELDTFWDQAKLKLKKE
jgi:XTP/dITP diphosphohydrolase